MNMFGLEGNIAAGKSSLGRALHQTGKLAFLEEPVEEWRTSKLLGYYYDDPDRWAFTLQIIAFNSRAKTWDEILALTDHSRILMERSVFSDRRVFARLLYELGHMTDVEYQGYNDMWDFVAAKWAIKPETIFYLRTPAEDCLARIANRGRSEEAGIEHAFLEHIEKLHDEWLLSADNVVLLNGCLPIGELVEQVLREVEERS